MRRLTRTVAYLSLITLSAQGFARDKDLTATPDDSMSFREAAPARGPASSARKPATVAVPARPPTTVSPPATEAVIGYANQYPFNQYNPDVNDDQTEGTFCLTCETVEPMRAKIQAQEIRAAAEAAAKGKTK